ncbi:MAG: hypothetical protein JWR35_1834 [Marmoricola sp.]|nr:hypothetical protein [Marmoricola sp.]
MPYTFAHPAAVVPLRRYLWLPGLVAGSIAPDLGYYVPVPGGSGFSHTLRGLFSTDIASSAELIVAAYLLIGPVLAVAPAGWRERITTPDTLAQLRSVRAALTLVASVIVGSATHILWDAFTHPQGRAVVHWTVFRDLTIYGHELYNVLSYLSALGGLVVVGVAVRIWHRNAPTSAPDRWPAVPDLWARIAQAAAVLAFLVGGAVGLAKAHEASGYGSAARFLVGATQGLGLVLFGYAVLWYAVLRPVVRRTADQPR